MIVFPPRGGSSSAWPNYDRVCEFDLRNRVKDDLTVRVIALREEERYSGPTNTPPDERIRMKPAPLSLTALFISLLGAPAAFAECQIGDAKLEEAILQKPQLRGKANRENVRALRSLRDAAFTLRSYGRHDECERLLATIRELIAGPSMGSLGDNDEEEAERQSAAREPKLHQGGKAAGHRQDKDA